MALATQAPDSEDSVPFARSAARPEADVMPQTTDAISGPQPVFGPIVPASAPPRGALSGRVIYMSGGHGWQASGTTWALDRPLLLEMNEDTGNADQMTLFAYYCFNAGATVVAMRPVGNQTSEVVLDNDDPGVNWTGTWANSSSTIYFGSVGDVPYRFCDAASVETATATYTPNIPQPGLYPVYCWALAGNNRTNQLYKIFHTGGQSHARVPHHLTGGGWVYLGTYHFNAGSNAANGSVRISNLGDDGIAMGVVIADAIRFGNGMGDVDAGGGVSTYPREDEGNRYWVQRAVGQGRSSTIYSGNTSSPLRMATEMNNEGSGNMYKRAYVGFHSNAANGSARGVVGLWNDTNAFPGTATPNQRDYALKLATEVNNDMVSVSSSLEFPWYNRTTLLYNAPDFAYGELNNTYISDEYDATIVEVAFHDNALDAALLRDPKARGWIARAVCQGMVRYMNAYDGGPLVFLPEPPWNIRAVAEAGGIRVSWDAPVAQAGSGAATGFVLYQSTNGFGFGNPLYPGVSSSLVVANVTAGADYYFRVVATNAGGESMPSETAGCRVAASTNSSRLLLVNGFTRFERTLNLRQNLVAENYKPPGHDANSGATDRVLPRRANSFDYVVAHGKAIAAVSQMGFDSCQVRAATNGAVPLGNYQIVIWHAGNESTNQRPFNSAAQTRIANYRAIGGHLFVSGSDVGFDLGRAIGPSLPDRQFLTNHLFGVLASDAQNSSGVYTFSAAAGSIFAGNTSGVFDDGGKGIYCVGSADALTPVGGAAAAISYTGYGGGAAAVRFPGASGTGVGKVLFMGFPFETITSEAARAEFMADILKDFSRRPVISSAQVAGGVVQFVASGEPALSYQVQSSTNFSAWTLAATVVNTNGTMTFSEPVGASPRKFYRVRTAP
jgi:hypothetical protein